MRLDKAVTLSGVSRSQAIKLLRAGRVQLNGQTETDGARKVSGGDEVRLDGEKLDLCLHHHFMVYKPEGCLTATRDERGQSTVMDLIAPQHRYKDLGPVGRLDKDVSGLVILTTDGELAHRLISPKRDIEKVYFAVTEGKLSPGDAEAFEKGIAFKDFTAKPARLEIICAHEEESLCRVYVREGKFHQVKRMLLAVGHPVIRLKREKIGALSLDETLEKGQYRALTDEETRTLYEQVGLEQE